MIGLLIRKGKNMNTDTIKIICPKCGEEIEANAKFCENCGEKLEAKFCSNCGEKLKANAKFCSKCGTKVE